MNKHYAIVPAAGHSRRMGQSKLLLPWGQGRIIDAVLEAWTASQVTQVVVVLRGDDHALAEACQRWPVTLVRTDQDPPDMKASIQIGLRQLSPQAESGDRCFIAPADLPTLSATVIDGLISTSSEQIVLPKFGSKAGHPALLPWWVTQEIFALAADQGVNQIVDRHPKQYVSFSPEKLVSDVDTPEQYQQLLEKTGTK